MPIYHYRCTTCNATQEVWAKFDDPPPETCESCGSPSLEKMVSRTAFKLAGGGWYAQGYSGSSPSTDASSGGGGDSQDSGGD